MCLHGKFRKNNKFNITAFYVCMVIQNKEPEAWQNFPVLLSGQLDIVHNLEECLSGHLPFSALVNSLLAISILCESKVGTLDSQRMCTFL